MTHAQRRTNTLYCEVMCYTHFLEDSTWRLELNTGIKAAKLKNGCLKPLGNPGNLFLIAIPTYKPEVYELLITEILHVKMAFYWNAM